ncbi:MAG: glycosyltransferase family 2 protein [Nocardioides sp.]
MSEYPDAVQAFLDQPGEHLVLTSMPGLATSGKYARVLVVVADRADLRAAVLPHALRTSAVAVWIAAADVAPGLVARPEWPPMKAFRSQPVGDGYLVVARFEQPVRVDNVVRELGRLSVWPLVGGAGGLVVDDGSGPGVPLEDRDVPPDVVLDPGAALVEHHVTGRVPVLVKAVDDIGPFDERVFNPIGFEAVVDGPEVELASLRGQRPSEALVRSLRPAAAVTGRAEGAHDAALVATLSMSGVPSVQLADPVAREEHSVLQRREALRTFSTAAWRRRAADRAGVRVATEPSVSVVLATRRPDMLGFALRQVRRQAGVDLQLVLAAHGFEPDADVLREHGPERVVVRPQSSDVLFGDVLNAGVEAADGDLVLKMDDDDWYSSDFVADLLLARSYSGAEMVGTPAEFHYLVEKDVTVRRGHRAELYAPFIAGGTMLVERGLLREVGGFRSVRRFVDAQLIAAVQRAGAATYRTHGLGYLLRRNASGHTWQVDDDYLLDPSRVAEIRPGFAPSRLLDVDEIDLP